MLYTWCQSAVNCVPLSFCAWLPCWLPYAIEVLFQDFPYLSPAPGFPFRISLGQVPWLHRFRSPGRTRDFVHRLLRYYGLVRLPVIVHLTSPKVRLRTTSPSSRGRSRDLPIPVHGVSERAWGLRPRGVRQCLALSAQPVLPSGPGNMSAPRFRFSRLNTQPVLPLTNASPSPCGSRRMMRGRSGSLLLPRMALSSTTPCRF